MTSFASLSNIFPEFDFLWTVWYELVDSEVVLIGFDVVLMDHQSCDHNYVSGLFYSVFYLLGLIFQMLIVDQCMWMLTICILCYSHLKIGEPDLVICVCKLFGVACCRCIIDWRRDEDCFCPIILLINSSSKFDMSIANL